MDLSKGGYWSHHRSIILASSSLFVCCMQRRITVIQLDLLCRPTYSSRPKEEDKSYLHSSYTSSKTTINNGFAINYSPIIIDLDDHAAHVLLSEFKPWF
jgi:hypothetical protein